MFNLPYWFITRVSIERHQWTAEWRMTSHPKFNKLHDFLTCPPHLHVVVNGTVVSLQNVAAVKSHHLFLLDELYVHGIFSWHRHIPTKV
jgi:hypothetical protein